MEGGNFLETSAEWGCGDRARRHRWNARQTKHVRGGNLRSRGLRIDGGKSDGLSIVVRRINCSAPPRRPFGLPRKRAGYVAPLHSPLRKRASFGSSLGDFLDV